MQVTRENYITARYTDNAKKIVEILYKEGDKVIPHIIEHDTEHPDWIELMSITNLDEIHLNTHNYIKQSQKDFRKMVMKIAKEDGMVKEVVAELSTPFYGEVFEFFLIMMINKKKCYLTLNCLSLKKSLLRIVQIQILKLK